MGALNGLFGILNAFGGEPEKDYDDPKYMADSWAWVQRENERGDEAGLMSAPKPQQATPYAPGVMSPKQEADKAAREAKNAAHTSPVSRWKRSIDNMMKSGNPNLQKKAMDSWNSYQNRASAKASELRRGKTEKDGGVTFAEFESWDTDKQTRYDEIFKGRKSSGDMQKFKLLASAKDQEEFNRFARMSGMNDVIDLGTSKVNPVTGKEWDVDLAGAEFEKGLGKREEEFVGGLSQDVSLDDAAYDTLTYTLESLNDLAKIDGYDATGFAKFWNFIPLTNAKEFEIAKQNVVSRLGLEKLLEMKRTSTTGGSGLGQLSEKELQVLQQYMANLDQASKPSTMKRAVAKIYKQLRDMQKGIRRRQKGKFKKYNQISGKYVFIPEDFSGYDSEEYDPEYLPEELRGTPLDLSAPEGAKELPATMPRKTGDEWEDDKYYYRKTASGTERSPK